MNQRFLVAINSRYLLKEPTCKNLVFQKGLFPIGQDKGFLGEQVKTVVRLKNDAGDIFTDEDINIHKLKGIHCLRLSPDTHLLVKTNIDNSDYVFVIIEGSSDNATIVLRFHNPEEDIFSSIETDNPTLRLLAFNLPPHDFTVIDAPQVKTAFHRSLSKEDEDLFSTRAYKFLNTPHIITNLFAHVMSLESKDHINYISILRVVSDRLREFLKPKIRKIEKNHHEVWARFYGERVSFLDAGMSRIVSLPGTEPMGIRVGIYTVIPGESDSDKREAWNLSSYVIGDVLSDRSIIYEEFYQTDTKRLQEAARYILEPLTAFKYVSNGEKEPIAVFLHGPLQNSFETYNELPPNFVPGVNQDFLFSAGLTKEEVEDLVEHIPKDLKGNSLWNGCIPIYALVMKKIFQSKIPFLGVVERSSLNPVTNAALSLLVEEKVIPESAKRKLARTIKKFDFNDEFLFGCILDEGEYIEPIEIVKNLRRRAQERWQLVVDQFPIPKATMLKCSANSFPYRVEMNHVASGSKLADLMSLLYHTSLLLPNYAFPVGIDIADKYAKIPDWLSKGISARLTANVLKRVLQEGDDRLLRQVRQLLARSPRDFFFRPKT